TVSGTIADEYFLIRANLDRTLGMIATIQTDQNGEPVPGGSIERINYDGDINGGVIVNGRAGDDTFVFDDNLASMIINGDAGDDIFQIGQVFQSPRDGTNPNNGLASEDYFATTPITKGYLSNGISHSTTINGGFGEDDFTVYRNLAELFLFGEEDDDTFTVRAFVKVNPDDPDAPFTNINGGQGADFIAFTVNAPVRIDGGDGFDTLTIIGTEFGDDFVVTADGVYGAGLFVTFGAIEKLTIDALQGNDTFWIASTSDKVAVEVVGGLGSDVFEVGGSDGKEVTVVSNSLGGHSGLVINTVSSTDEDYLDIFVQDISSNVADNDEAGVFVDVSNGSLIVFEHEPESNTVKGPIRTAFDALQVYHYDIVLTRSPASTVVITAKSAKLSERLLAIGAKGLALATAPVGAPAPLYEDAREIGTTLVFDRTNWYVPQRVYVFAAHDDAVEGSRVLNIQHSLVEGTSAADGDPYDGLAILGVVVSVIDDDMAEVVIIESNDETLVSERVITSSGTTEPGQPIADDTYKIVLTRAPLGQVDIRIDEDGQTNQGENVSFGTGDWFNAQTITVTANQDFEKEGLHFSRLNHVITSDLDDFLGLSIERVAKGLEQSINGDIDRSYKATANGSTVTVSNERPFTVIDDRPADADPASLAPNRITNSDISAFVHAYTSLTLQLGEGALGETYTVIINGQKAKGVFVTSLDDLLGVLKSDIESEVTGAVVVIDTALDTINITIPSPGPLAGDLPFVAQFLVEPAGGGQGVYRPLLLAAASETRSTTHYSQVQLSLDTTVTPLLGDQWGLLVTDLRPIDPSLDPAVAEALVTKGTLDARFAAGARYKSTDLIDVAAGLAATITNDPTDGLTATAFGRVLTITFTEAFDFTITAPAGTGPDDFTADVDSSTPGTVVVTLGGSAPI
ncbi:hypothetical protein N9549_07040, partial [Acidimicrobiales bacterium]|nr:hypothetical protein [Acidimicrobiales bacterium]